MTGYATYITAAPAGVSALRCWMEIKTTLYSFFFTGMMMAFSSWAAGAAAKQQHIHVTCIHLQCMCVMEEEVDFMQVKMGPNQVNLSP